MKTLCPRNQEICVAIQWIAHKGSRLMSRCRSQRRIITLVIGDELKLGMTAFIMGMISLILLHLVVVWVLSHLRVTLNPCITYYIIVFSEVWIIFSDLNWAVKEADKVLVAIICRRDRRDSKIYKRWSLSNQFTKLDRLWELVAVCETEKVCESIFAGRNLLCLFLLNIYHLPIFGRIKEYLV